MVRTKQTATREEAARRANAPQEARFALDSSSSDSGSEQEPSGKLKI